VLWTSFTGHSEPSELFRWSPCDRTIGSSQRTCFCTSLPDIMNCFRRHCNVSVYAEVSMTRPTIYFHSSHQASKGHCGDDFTGRKMIMLRQTLLLQGESRGFHVIIHLSNAQMASYKPAVTFLVFTNVLNLIVILNLQSSVLVQPIFHHARQSNPVLGCIRSPLAAAVRLCS